LYEECGETGYVGEGEADISSLRPFEVVKDDYAGSDLLASAEPWAVRALSEPRVLAVTAPWRKASAVSVTGGAQAPTRPPRSGAC